MFKIYYNINGQYKKERKSGPKLTGKTEKNISRQISTRVLKKINLKQERKLLKR